MKNPHAGKLGQVVAPVDHDSRAVRPAYGGVPRAACKANHSALTLAGLVANAILCKGLIRHWLQIPVLTEEAVSPFGGHEESPLYLAVDSLDGTRESILRNHGFLVRPGADEH